MKKIIFLLMLLFLTACSNQAPSNFQEAADLIDDLDKKYSASFKTEHIPTNIVNLDNISPYLNELRPIKSSIDTSTDNGKYASQLIEGRMEMLEAQREYHLAINIGEKGSVLPTFKCSDMPSILQFNKHFKSTLEHSLNAITLFDELLTQHKESVNYIGIDETKSMFFVSRLDDINFEVLRNKRSLEQNCGYQEN